MKTNLVFLNVLLFVLILFFGSAVLSNIWIQIEYIKKFSLDILILIFLDFLNIFFVFSLITLKKGLASYMKRGVFEIIQSTL